jgi:hypothetical protein
MPRKARPGTTPVLAQIPDDVHQAADRRRRQERRTWSVVISKLLTLYAFGAGDDELAAAVKPLPKLMAPEPGSERAQFIEWSERWKRENPELAAKAYGKVDVTNLKRYRSVAELFAATAAREGRTVSAETLADLDLDDDDVRDV